MEVYLDNAATTKTMDLVVKKVVMSLSENYGNPSSLHKKGIEAEKDITCAKNILADILKVDKKELFFTSGGTESNNLAIFGIAKAYNRSGKHIILSGIEHPSVNKAIRHLEEEGYEVSVLPVDSKGIIDLHKLRQLIRTDTILVSVMHVNNEIGVIQPIEKIGQLIKEINPTTVFHVDGVQSFGKLIIHPKKAGIDCLSASGHKIYAPKGIGLLYIQSKLKMKPIFYGGEQQSGIRSGTENVPGIIGLATAAEWMYKNHEEVSKKYMQIYLRLLHGIINNIDGAYINGPTEDEIDINAPYILNMRFDNVRGEVLLHALESKGIYVSTGSACSSNKPEPSATLLALGLSREQVDQSIRFSFSIENTKEEIDYCINQLIEIIPVLRKFTRH